MRTSRVATKTAAVVPSDTTECSPTFWESKSQVVWLMDLHIAAIHSFSESGFQTLPKLFSCGVAF